MAKRITARAALTASLVFLATSCSDGSHRGAQFFGFSNTYEALDATTGSGALLRNLPGNPSNQKKLDVEVYGNSVTHYIFALVDGSQLCQTATYSSRQSIDTHINVDVSGDGLKRLCVKGAGEQLGYQTKPTEFVWEFDATPPGTFDFVGLQSLVRNPPSSVTWSPSDGANTYRFQVSASPSCDPNAGTLIPAANLQNPLGSLPDGIHYLCLSAIDLAGNSTPATSSPFALKVDQTAPGPFHIFSPLTITNDQKPTISWTTPADASAINYQLVLADNSGCQNPIESIGTQQQPHTSPNYTVTQSLADRRYYVCLTASDAVGNTVRAENSPYEFYVDTVSPLISFEHLPAANSNVTTLGIGVTSTSSDFYSFRYKIIDGRRNCEEVGSYGQEVLKDTVISDSIAGVPDGLLRICVISRDVVGNWTAADKAQSYTWRKDTIAPTLSAVVQELCGPIICPRGGTISISPISAGDQGSGLASLYLKLTAPDGQCFKQNLTGFEACTANSFIAVPGTPSTFDIPNDVFHNKNLRGVYEFSLKAVDQAGNEKTISKRMTWDNVAPVFSVSDGVTISTREDQNYLVAPAPTKVNFLKVKLSANDSLSKIQKYCLKYLSESATTPAIPTRTDGCWKVIPSTNQSQTLALNNLPLTVSFFPDTYKIFAWVMDAADNMSAISNVVSVKYNPIKPPVFSHVYATYTPNDELPKTSNTMAPAGSSRDVYIRWAVSTTNRNGLKPLSLMYTIDDEVYVAAGIAGFSPEAEYRTSDTTCKLSAANNAASKAYAGCIKYTLPDTVDRNKFLRFRIIAEDADGYITFAQTNALHLNKFTFLAGNTEAGLGSTALSAIINPKGTQNLAVHPSGQIFILDERGLLFVDPLDGVLKVHPKSSSFPNATKIALDKNGDIVVLDGNTIKKLDLSTGSPTVTTIIGGGTDTSNTITRPLDLRIKASPDQIFFTAPNGDIYFMSESYWTREANDPLRVRRAVFASNYEIESVIISGSVKLFKAAANEGPEQYDLNKCRLMSAAFTFDSSLETPTTMFPLIGPGSQAANLSSCWLNKPGNPFHSFFDYAPFKADASTLKLNLSVTVPPFLVSFSNSQSGIREGAYVRYFQSLSGKLFARVNGVKDNHDSIVEFNGSTWKAIAGQDRGGECLDGTVATDCALNLSAIFVDSNDRVYMMDNDVVRVIQDDGKILTIAGETRSAGDGKNPLNARFNELTAFDIYPKTSSDPKFVISDAKAMKIRKFSENGTIDSVAGNGVDAANPNLADFAKGHSLTWGDDGPNSGLVVDDSGNILVMKFQGQIPYKINESTGKWESLTGSSSVPTIGGGYGAHVLGMNGPHVLFGTFNWLREQLATGNGRLYVLPISGSIPSQLSPVLSKSNAVEVSNPQYQYKFDPQNMLCSSGTKRLECNGPYSSSVQLPQATFDAENSRWLLGVNNLGSVSARIIGFQVTANPDSDLVQDVLSLPTNRVQSFTIAGSLGTNSKRAYVCLDSGSLVKYTISATGASGGVQVPFPVPGMKCSSVARSMIYSTQRRATEGGTLIFSYELNGLQGIAEIVNP